MFEVSPGCVCCSEYVRDGGAGGGDAGGLVHGAAGPGQRRAPGPGAAHPGLVAHRRR